MNQAALAYVSAEHVEVEICRVDELERYRGLSSELDEMWSYVGKKANQRWLWHAIDHHTGKVLAYVFGRRKDDVLLRLKALLAPFGITRYYTRMAGEPMSAMWTQRAIPLGRRTCKGSRASTPPCGHASSG